MLTRFILGLALVACSGADEPREKASRCYLGALVETQAVSCYGEMCLVCTANACRSLLINECR